MKTIQVNESAMARALNAVVGEETRMELERMYEAINSAMLYGYAAGYQDGTNGGTQEDAFDKGFDAGYDHREAEQMADKQPSDAGFEALMCREASDSGDECDCVECRVGRDEVVDWDALRKVRVGAGY